MKHIHLTWYLLVDGTQTDPDDVAPGDDGVLRHKSGLAVALHESGVPMTIGVSAKENKNVEAARAGDEAAAEAKKHMAEEARALKAEAASDVAETAIDPATGKPVAEEAAVEPKADEKPVDAKNLKPAAPRKYKTREVKGR